MPILARDIAKPGVRGRTRALEDQRIADKVSELNPWGKTFYVQSAHANATNSGNHGERSSAPLATIAAAIALCTADQGDVIIVGPNHVETVASATGLVLNKAGVLIKGLGNGKSDAPKINLTTATTAKVHVTADGVTIQGFQFAALKDAIVYGLHVAAADFRLVDCWIDDTSSFQTVDFVFLDDADGAIIQNCEFNQATAGAGSAIHMEDGERITILDCRFYGNYAAAAIEVTTTLVTILSILGNWIDNLNAVDVGIKLMTACTGEIGLNRIMIATNAETTWINTPGNVSLFENYGVNLYGETGLLIGTVSA